MWDQLSRVRKSLQPVVLCVGWPEPYISTVYDCIFGVISLPKIPYTYVHRVYMDLANPIYDLLKTWSPSVGRVAVVTEADRERDNRLT
jgi:hypothetical protein